MVSTSNGTQQRVRTSTEMFPLIRAWEESGQSQKEFCIAHGIKPHIFWYWLRRYREDKHQQKEPPKGFIPVKVEAATEDTVLAEIIYSDGTRLVFKERVGVKLLQSLLPKAV